MSELGGLQTFDALLERDPEVRVLISSGFAQLGDVEALRSLRERGLRGYVPKPYRLRALAEAVACALEG